MHLHKTLVILCCYAKLTKSATDRPRRMQNPFGCLVLDRSHSWDRVWLSKCLCASAGRLSIHYLRDSPKAPTMRIPWNQFSLFVNLSLVYVVSRKFSEYYLYAHQFSCLLYLQLKQNFMFPCLKFVRCLICF